MGSFLMMARFFTILITPSASVTVTTIGRPSGMAATARLGVEGGGEGDSAYEITQREANLMEEPDITLLWLNMRSAMQTTWNHVRSCDNSHVISLELP